CRLETAADGAPARYVGLPRGRARSQARGPNRRGRAVCADWHTSVPLPRRRRGDRLGRTLLHGGGPSAARSRGHHRYPAPPRPPTDRARAVRPDSRPLRPPVPDKPTNKETVMIGVGLFVGLEAKPG